MACNKFVLLSKCCKLILCLFLLDLYSYIGCVLVTQELCVLCIVADDVSVINIDLILIWLFSRQGPQTGASHRQAVVCEQLAQGCCLRVQWLGIEPPTSRSVGPTR